MKTTMKMIAQTKVGLMAAVAMLALALTAHAEDKNQKKAGEAKPESTILRGTIKKIDGNTLTVGDKTVTIDDKTVVKPGGKGALKVGAPVSVNIQHGVVVRIEFKDAPIPYIRGVISKIEGNNLTVGKETVVIDDKTEVVPGGKDALKVGVDIDARIHDGVADRLEVHQPK